MHLVKGNLLLNFLPVHLLRQFQKVFNDTCDSHCLHWEVHVGTIPPRRAVKTYSPLLRNPVEILIVPTAWQPWDQFPNSAKVLSELRDCQRWKFRLHLQVNNLNASLIKAFLCLKCFWALGEHSFQNASTASRLCWSIHFMRALYSWEWCLGPERSVSLFSPAKCSSPCVDYSLFISLLWWTSRMCLLHG